MRVAKFNHLNEWDSATKILASQPCSLRTNIQNGRENSVNGVRWILWGELNREGKTKWYKKLKGRLYSRKIIYLCSQMVQLERATLQNLLDQWMDG